MFTGSVVQDITADGWILNKLPQKLKYAGPIQSLGTQVGTLISFSVYSMVETNVDWFTFKEWMIIVISALVITNTVIVCAVSEGEEKLDDDVSTVKVLTLILRKVKSVPYFWQLGITMFVLCLSFATVYNSKLFAIQLQEHNFSRDQIGKIELYLAPLWKFQIMFDKTLRAKVFVLIID